MACSIWQSAKHRASSRYQPRLPTTTALYRIVYHFREALEYSWEELFQSRYGALRQVVLDAFDAYLNCGVFAHGCARICCEDCGHSELLAFSCKRRCLCPSCDAKRGHIFAEQLHEHVLPKLPLRHLVWTMPKRIRPYFRFDRSLNYLLYQAAWQSWHEYCDSELPCGTSGAVIALHTAGSLLNFHPHLHALHLDGVVDDAQQFHQLQHVDTGKLEALFAGRLRRMLCEKKLLTADALENMASWEHSGFIVHAGEVIEPADHEQRLFVSRYLLKCPVSLKRMEIMDEPLHETIRYFRQADDITDFKDFSPLEFLAELQQHIPNVWEQLIHYYGVMSPRTRGKKRALPASLLREPSPEQEHEPKKPASRTWAIWIKRVYEFDPLICPNCGGHMKVKAFIHDMSEISRFTEHLGFPAWRAPPPLRASSIAFG